MNGRLVYGTDQVKMYCDDYNRNDVYITIQSDWCGSLDFVEVDKVNGIITVHMKNNPNEKHFNNDGDFIQDDKDSDVVVRSV